jgi:hypothetical protein
VIILIVLVAIIRFPQLYGKNYAVFPESTYYFNTKNLHSTSMNTIWTGETEDYAVKNKKGEIVSGEGVIEKATIHNSQRAYQIAAATPITMADYTFYFPGWNVYIDGQPTEIQFQDPNYRGVITYTVPAGHHIIDVKLEDTKVRLLSKVISLISFLFLGGLLLFKKKLNKFIVSI